MADLLGPASAPNAVTVRPSDARVFGGSDTWLQDCSSPSALDGTAIQAAYLNGILAQIRRAIRGMAITESNTDDDMLLKAIQAAGAGYVTQANLNAYLAMYPNATLGGGVTLSTGQIIVNSSGSNFCIWRGSSAKDATQLTGGQRTFATVANKTYHLRWSRVNGLLLRDLADVSYNPGALAETNAAFDSTYDDALMGRVTTNGSNVLTFQALANSPRLETVGIAALSVTSSGTNTTTGSATVTLNWARTPFVMLSQQQAQAVDSTAHENDFNIGLSASSRYGFSISMLDDWVTALGAYYHSGC